VDVSLPVLCEDVRAALAVFAAALGVSVHTCDFDVADLFL
jgi:hypothetical protein